MARTIAEIKAEIAANYIANATIVAKYDLDVLKTFDEQFSKVSVESIFFYVVAASLWVIEKLFDTHKIEVTDLINKLKPHSSLWYSLKAKSFQSGFDLLTDSDEFNNTNKTDAEIAASKIITYAAVVEQEKQLLIKVAKTQSGDLAKLTVGELAAFNEYISRIKDAGVFVSTLSDDPEQLKLVLKIYYNPLVMKADGSRVDGTEATPVSDTVRLYLQTISFDGTLVLTDMIDKLQAVDGIVIPHVVSAAYKYGLLDWISFDVLHRPMSGYIRVANENLTITYEPRSAQ